MYVALEQMVWREPRTEHDEGLHVLGQYGFSPDDRNLYDVDFSVGLLYQGLLPDRPIDRFGIGYFHPRLSREYRAANPGSRTESVAEATYRAEISPGFAMQAAVQYVFNPGGASVTGFDDAVVAFLRAEIAF